MSSGTIHSVPQFDAPHVQTFCTEISSADQPLRVICQPQFDQSVNDCFSIVARQVSSHGGSMAIGWAIWEWPGVFIEAEFHAVWASPEAMLVDLNPRTMFVPEILFLSDPARQYEGRSIDNIRKPLVRDNDLIRYLFIFRRQFEILNKGDLAYQYGEISLLPGALKEYQSLQKEGARLERRLQNRYSARA